MTDFFNARTPYHSLRKANLLIVHGTEVDDATARNIFEGQSLAQGSAHYYIDDQGNIEQYLDETARAWHAGKGYWAGMTDINSLSIGIELLAVSSNRKFDGAETSYTSKQIDALIQLGNDIMTRHQIAPCHVLSHQDVASGRLYEPEPGTLEEMLARPSAGSEKKYDPGPFFPWQKLAAGGVGVWHDTNEGDDKIVEDNTAIQKFADNLRLYGYDPRPLPQGREFKDVVKAFQTHFLPWNICGQVTENSVTALDQLLAKKFA